MHAGDVFSNLRLMLRCCFYVLKTTFLGDFIIWFDHEMWDLIFWCCCPVENSCWLLAKALSPRAITGGAKNSEK